MPKLAPLRDSLLLTKNRRLLLRLTTISTLLWLAALLCVSGSKAAAPPVSPPTAQQLAKLVADLGADNFATREKASKALMAVGAEAVPALASG